MPKYKKALVTGGAGFIGSHVVDALVRRRIKTYVVDDLSTGLRGNLNPNAEFIRVSIVSPALTGLVKKIKPDVILHYAAMIDVRAAVKDPLKDARTNIMGSLQLLQAAKETKVKKVIFASTGGAMYSDRLRPPYSEKIPAEPISPYGIAKRAAEMYLHFYFLQYGLPYVALRYANVYGPRQGSRGEAGVVSIFAKQLLAGKQPLITGSGKQTRDFVYVEDAARAAMLAIAKDTTGIFHIGTGKETSINTLYKKLLSLTQSDAKIKFGPAAPGEVLRSALDARQARQVLGWSPQVKLDEGLLKTINWFRKQVK